MRRLGVTARDSPRIDLLSFHSGTEGYGGGEGGEGDSGGGGFEASNNRCGVVDHVWESVRILKSSLCPKVLSVLVRVLGRSI